MWVILAIILSLAAVGVYWWWRTQTTNTNVVNNANITANNVGNTNTSVTISGPAKYENNVVPFTLDIPSTAIVREQHVSSTTINGIAYPSFTLSLIDSRVSGELTISNRDTGFETEMVLSESHGSIDGRPVRTVLSEGVDALGNSTTIKRWFFSPLNSGTRFESLWISYPVDSVEQTAYFDNVVSRIKLIQDVLTNAATNSPSNTNAVDTSGWKTYTSQSWGLSVKYPADVTVIESTDKTVVEFRGPQQGSNGFLPRWFITHGSNQFYNPPADTDVQSWIKGNTVYDELGDSYSVAQLPTMHVISKASPQSSGADFYYVINGTKLFAIQVRHEAVQDNQPLDLAFLEHIVFNE